MDRPQESIGWKTGKSSSVPQRTQTGPNLNNKPKRRVVTQVDYEWLLRRYMRQAMHVQHPLTKWPEQCVPYPCIICEKVYPQAIRLLGEERATSIIYGT